MLMAIFASQLFRLVHKGQTVSSGKPGEQNSTAYDIAALKSYVPQINELAAKKDLTEDDQKQLAALKKQYDDLVSNILGGIIAMASRPTRWPTCSTPRRCAGRTGSWPQSSACSSCRWWKRPSGGCGGGWR